MSQLLARILLAVFVIPMGSLIYLVTSMKAELYFDRAGNWSTWREHEQLRYLITGVITWAFVAGWWILLWWKSVRWNALRLVLTAVSAVVAAGLGLLIGVLFDESEWLGYFIGSASVPVFWLVGTIFVWRETAAERAERVDASGRDTIVCPTCGYNLTGLKESRCPECGTQFTLDQLLASQPGKATAEIEE